MTSLTDPAMRTFGFDYDAASRPTLRTLPNGTFTEYSYDAAGRLEAVANRDASTDIASFTHTLNGIGDRTETVDAAGTHTFTYDALNRLAAAVRPPLLPNETYGYDSGGNRITSHLSATYTYDTTNRLLEDADYTYEYDPDGNLIERTHKTTSATDTFAYDGFGQRTSASFGDGTSVTYRYDALGRRIEKAVNGDARRYLYDGDALLYEIDATGAALARYTHASGTDQPLARDDGSVVFYHPDGLGSIYALSDATGAVAQTYTYDSFGHLLAETGSTVQSFTYTARERDGNEYYYRARYYDARIGRFLSEDPLKIAVASGAGDVTAATGNGALYAYVEDNPLNYTDPFGLYSIDPSCDKPPFNRRIIEQAVQRLIKTPLLECMPTLAFPLWFRLNIARFKCSPTPQELCAEAPYQKRVSYMGWENNWISLDMGLFTGRCQFLSGHPLESFILHELVHQIEIVQKEHGKRAYGCQIACFGPIAPQWGNPDANACPEDCRP
jgi:RHS repeat-associated protein